MERTRTEGRDAERPSTQERAQCPERGAECPAWSHLHRSASLPERIDVGEVLARVHEAGDVNLVTPGELDDLVVGADLVALVRRVRDAVADVEDVHGKNRTSRGPIHWVIRSGSFLQSRMGHANAGFLGVRSGMAAWRMRQYW